MVPVSVTIFCDMCCKHLYKDIFTYQKNKNWTQNRSLYGFWFLLFIKLIAFRRDREISFKSWNKNNATSIFYLFFSIILYLFYKSHRNDKTQKRITKFLACGFLHASFFKIYLQIKYILTNMWYNKIVKLKKIKIMKVIHIFLLILFACICIFLASLYASIVYYRWIKILSIVSLLWIVEVWILLVKYKKH